MTNVLRRFHYSILLFLLIISISPVLADENSGTRTAELEKQREAKEKNLKPPPPEGFIGKLFGYVENSSNPYHFGSTLEGSSSGFSPQIGTIVTASGTAFGAGYHLKGIRISAAYSLRGYKQGLFQ